MAIEGWPVSNGSRTTTFVELVPKSIPTFMNISSPLEVGVFAAETISENVRLAASLMSCGGFSRTEASAGSDQYSNGFCVTVTAGAALRIAGSARPMTLRDVFFSLVGFLEVLLDLDLPDFAIPYCPMLLRLVL